MKKTLWIAGLLSAVALIGSDSATVIQTWDLTNKSPGALGADYGLRLNQMNQLGLTPGSSTNLIFDFERAGYGVQLQLVDAGGGALELHLSGTAYGALFDNSVADGYGTDYAGSYQLDFIWRNVEIDVGGFDLVADYGLGQNTQGAGSGTVLGLDAGTAFQGASVLNLFDWTGSYTHTMDVRYDANPDGTGWLSYGNGSHNGDYAFNMVAVVPEPGSLLLMSIGLIGFGASRRRRA
ncbi:MAG: PEP-CTERM sorting domain-containing protein [Pseudomonadota bacterium]